MNSVIAERVIHKGESRIALRFAYDAELITQVKELFDARWSSTMRYWHMPDNERTLERIVNVFSGKANIDLSEILSSAKANKQSEFVRGNSVQKTEISKPEPQFPQHLNFSPEALGKKFQNSPLSEGMKNEMKAAEQIYGAVEFTINEPEDRLVIRFTGRYDKEWIQELKSYGWVTFDPVRLEWLLSWSRMKADSLSDYFSSKGVEVIVKKAEVPLPIKEQREEQGAQIRDRELGVNAIQGIENVRRFLNEKRYSINTVQTYISLLELFFKYFSEVDPPDITEDDISDFFNDYITFNNYSASYHNQLISAIKIYYKLNGSKSINSSLLGRPRRTRSLPKVLSKEEVKRILNSTRNLKHKLILWMIYSCGLRRSEATNINLRDLDRDRRILNVREAKGMTDRIVPVPEMVWAKIDEYIDSYRPVFWLFEGQTGGRYSSESVYRVFKKAMHTAGIKKDVGVHSLRHSYATHLHENGLDIRYIQELLGHRSTRTTEIYTHVSRRNLVSVRSPIEDLGLK